ncbi:hypothetical protein [Hymenobacter sp. GOD-10R]|uniref:hypothetical protein n=1 Tax=Hymenobacter sp. GOD-10R TaxID=3093922 RepID=UPI002D78B1E5|nr:hypothetical protein [Hymenobacter sp. GOD-10R]WRQ28136.1 hypothetical protein SD425_24020 [Hymenobacter sp. GOD-10R]
MNTIKIFLASSSELVDDRKALREFISVENDRLHEENIYIKILQWEYFIDHMSQESLQAEYNKAVEQCDIFLSLFFTKVGKYTTEEFDKAFGRFKEIGKPFIYTYFRDSNITTSKINKSDIISKFDFEEKLADLGHFKTNYTDINDLKYKFKTQLDILIPEIIKQRNV